MDNPTQPPTNNAILMTTSPVAWGFHGNYEDFVKNELVPVDDPPNDGNCAICRLDFAHQDQGQEVPSDEHVFGMTTQARILAAALAAATVEETPPGNVVQIWKCSHFFHKDCICTWIDGDVTATAARRSCPLCKTELVRYDPLARARAVYREILTHQETINGLNVVYRNAASMRAKMQGLRIDINRLRLGFSHDPYALLTSSRDNIRVRLRNLMQAAGITDERSYLDQLDQLIMFGGHSVRDSVDLVYRSQLSTSEAKFESQKRDILARLQPIYTKLEEIEQILKELAEVLYQSWGYSPAHASARLLEDFGTADSDEMFPWLLDALNGQSNVEIDLHFVVIDAEWMRKKAAWTKKWLDPAEYGVSPVNAGGVEDEGLESTAGTAGTAGEGGGSGVVHVEDVEELGESHHQDRTGENAGVGYTEDGEEEEQDESVVYTEYVEEQEGEEQDQDELYHDMAEMHLGSQPHEF
ncbi:uncharacterized protein J4E87_010050 [Alternaria ethzedia]|uniref:uncharacterized protein n=1 Tax=Alternaria ethzedia TaxID=181014 RepID=UPI0020C278E0|nr:uncharacterized protein J4E87_010050 [Alternaria ethzedia]KAI4612787.1 hypothetical protein J4E87_010050 [Alternaria ethzedia]